MLPVITCALCLHGQSGYKSEIGIGIGSYGSYNAYGHKINDRNKIISVKKFNNEANDAVRTAGIRMQNVSQSYTLPAFYFSRYLDPHLVFTLTYQFAYAKGYLNDQNFFVNHDRPFRIRNHFVQFGFRYSIFKNNILNPYIGAGFDVDTYFGKYDTFYKEKLMAQKHWEDGMLLPYISTGLSVKIHTRYSLKYDLSLSTDFEALLYRPVNQLSLNYQF
jgi:hypothetical protein